MTKTIKVSSKTPLVHHSERGDWADADLAALKVLRFANFLGTIATFVRLCCWRLKARGEFIAVRKG
jgi:hypothetical protein